MRSFLNLHTLLLGVLLVVPHCLTAGPSSYVCEIADFKVPGPNVQGRQWLAEIAMETTVAIDRETGRVIHPTIGNTDFTIVTLLNRGSAEWSFKALADSGKGGHMRFYEVLEYHEGALKPFLAVANGIAFLGTCR